jgi:hypothetical protein
MPLHGECDRTAIAVRCVAAAEIYKLTGRLPLWAQATAATRRN